MVRRRGADAARRCRDGARGGDAGPAGDRHRRGRRGGRRGRRPPHRPVGRRPGRAGRGRALQDGGDACAQAAVVADRNRARLRGCEVEGWNVVASWSPPTPPGCRAGCSTSRPGVAPDRRVGRGTVTRPGQGSSRCGRPSRAPRACTRRACCSARRPACGRRDGRRRAWRALRNIGEAEHEEQQGAHARGRTPSTLASRLKEPRSSVVASPPPNRAAITSRTATIRTMRAATNTGHDPFRGVASTLVGRSAREQEVEQRDRAGFVERVVLVAALRRLHARRAARRRRRRTRSPPGWRAASGAAAWKPRSAKPAPPGWPSWTKTVSRPVSGCSAVETPPMSQRSQVANSGSRPIEACSAAWAAPGRSASASAGLGEHVVGQRPPHRRGLQHPLGQVERLLADHLARGHPPLQEGHHLVGDPHVAQAQPGLAPGHRLALAEDLDVGDLAGRGRVVGVGRAPRPRPTPRGRAR